MARNLQSHSFVKKKRMRLWRTVAIGLLCAIILTGACSWILRMSWMSISDVEVFGADPDITGGIHDLAVNTLAGSYLGIFPHKNILIYPKSAIISAIKSNFPRVLDVDVAHDGLDRIRVTIDQKTPAAVVCATLPNFDENILVYDPTDPCYFADSTGFLFEKSPGFSGHPYHIYYAPDIVASGTDNDYVGAYATSTSEFDSLQSFYDGAEHDGIAGDAILLENDGEYELYSSSTIIYFNDEEGLPTELSNLTAFWSHMTSDPTRRQQPAFDYIDLRYSPNVFYKTIE
jgi:hypothetical protein